MPEKILLAVDGSESGFEVVSIVGNLMKDHPDLQLSLIHCVMEMAALLRGELYAGIEMSPTLKAAEQERVAEVIFGESLRRLRAVGIPESRVTFKMKAFSGDPAVDILAEAESEKIRTIAVGRRGLNRVQTFLLGSVSNKVAHYAKHHTVWIVDTPVHESPRVLVAMEGVADGRALAAYVAEVLAPVPPMEYSLIHLLPPVPPTYWDDGHILDVAERSERERDLDKWRGEHRQEIESIMFETRDLLVRNGVPEQKVTMVIQPTKQGIARDLLDEAQINKCQFFVMGKRSFQEKKPFLMGSHANKVLQNLKGAILCLVDADS